MIVRIRLTCYHGDVPEILSEAYTTGDVPTAVGAATQAGWQLVYARPDRAVLMSDSHRVDIEEGTAG